MNRSPDNQFEELEPLLDVLRVWMSRTKVYIINPKRAAEMKNCFEKLRRIFQREDPDAGVEYLPCPLQTGSVSIVVTCDMISIENVPEFLRAVAAADSISVDCLTDLKLRVIIGFDNVFKLIGSFSENRGGDFMPDFDHSKL